MRAGVVGLWLVASACGVQATTGLAARAPYVGSLDVAGRVAGTRASGPYAGSDIVLALPDDGTFGLRHVLVTGGMRVRALKRLSLELGVELGAGQPSSQRWDGTGVYLGLSPTLLLRVSGEQDTRVGYAVAAVLWDLVAALRAGVWSPPLGDTRSELVEAALTLGVRLSVASDVAVSNNPDWTP